MISQALSIIIQFIQTLGAINYNSAIPQPASALKRSNSISNIKAESHLNAPHTSQHGRSMSSSRMSLAPNRPQQPLFQRSSSGANMAEFGRPSTAQRTSSSNIFGNAASVPRMSYAPASMHTPHSQPPMSASQSVQRRSSVYSSSTGPASHQSFFAQGPVPAGVPKDPRPLKDGAYRAKIGQELLDYLTKNNFELDMRHGLSQNTMTRTTQKDFDMMFQWLYHRLDPGYKFQKNIAAEVPPLLKQLRYPYEKSITKSQLSAVGGQNWLTFLGLLHWMMQLAQMLDRYNQGEYDGACADAGVDVSGDRIIFRFLSGAYRDWIQAGDYPEGEEPPEEVLAEEAKQLVMPHVEAMAAEFQQGNQQYEEELKLLEAEHEALTQRIEEAEKGAPDLAKLEKHFRILEDDKRKFEEYIRQVEEKVQKYEDKIPAVARLVADAEQALQDAEREKIGLQQSVDKQGITIQDIDRMNSERERLSNSVYAASSKLEETKKRCSEKEVEANRTLEDLERTLDKYNSLCYQINLIPSTASNAKGEDFEVRLNTSAAASFSSSQHGQSENDRLLSAPGTGYHPAQLLNLDLRGHIKSQLVGLRKEINERRTQAIDADMKNHELLDSIKEAIDDKRSEVEALEHRVRAAEEEFEKTKEVTSTQKLASDAQVEKMEKELAKMRSGLTESVQLMEQREMNTNIEYVLEVSHYVSGKTNAITGTSN